MRLFTILSAIALAALSSQAAVYNVRDFGATGDDSTLDTKAVQKALDACESAGGTVEFPPGTYLCEPLTLHSKTIFQVDNGAVLEAVTNQAVFMKEPGDWLKAKNSGDFIPFVSGKDLAGVTITGGGIIDGGGSAWWGEAEKARQIKSGYTLPRPNLIVLERCRDVHVENIELRNSPKFHLVPSDCDNVVVSNVTILAPAHAANTDAIDPSGRHILITKCKIDVGDDNVAIKAGKRPSDGGFESEDITVTDCTFLHGHGVSIGSETAGGVRNVLVKNCTFTDTENGLRIKSDSRRGGIVENITYQDIRMTNVNPAITFTCLYQMNSAGDPKRPAGTETGEVRKGGNKIPVYRQIRISNLTATCPKAAGVIAGLPQSCISNVVLENVSITAAKSFQIQNAKAVQLKNVTVKVAKGEPFILQNAEVSGVGSGQ